MKIKNIAMAAIALAGLSSMAPAPMVQVQNENQPAQSQKAQKDQIVEPKHSQKINVVQEAGGMQVLGYGYGIPPHIYGMHHVRKGTHKKTNK